MYYGKKLTELRELYCLSKKDLAEKLNLTEQSIWLYENDSVIPKIEVYNQLKSLFNVETSYLFSNDYLNTQSFSADKIAFRSKGRIPRKKEKNELAYLAFIDYYIDYFEEPLIIPEAPIISLQNECITTINNFQNSEKNERISDIAIMARNKLELEDNKDLMYILERSGIYIVEKNNGTEIESYSAITSEGRPYIILGTEKKSAVKRNFDLAHELGHIVLHSEIAMSELSTDELKVIDDEASYFAYVFLLPADEFKNDFVKLRHKSNPNYYLDLKRKYLVSIVALESRANELKLMTYEQNRYFRDLVTRKKYKIIEPLDDELPPIRPGRIRSLVKLDLDNAVFELSSTLQEFNILPSFLEKLFNFDADFFEPYLKVEKDYFSGAKLVDFKDYNPKK